MGRCARRLDARHVVDEDALLARRPQPGQGRREHVRVRFTHPDLIGYHHCVVVLASWKGS